MASMACGVVAGYTAGSLSSCNVQHPLFRSANGGQGPAPRLHSSTGGARAGLLDWLSASRPEDREAQRRAQMEMLEARRKGTSLDEAKERRAEMTRYFNDPEFKKEKDDALSKKYEKEAEEADNMSNARINIVIPIIPFGITKYDMGERFDLKAPYADEGWVDPEADLGKKVSNWFNFGKKEEEEKSGDEKTK